MVHAKNVVFSVRGRSNNTSGVPQNVRCNTHTNGRGVNSAIIDRRTEDNYGSAYCFFTNNDRLDFYSHCLRCEVPVVGVDYQRGDVIIGR